jgi:hypothetical protein
MTKMKFFCRICVCWYELEILSREEAERAINRGESVVPPTCPRGHLLARAA